MKTTALGKSIQKDSPSRMIHGRSKPETRITPIHPLVRLQQVIGNQAVSRLIQAELQIVQSGDAYEQEADRVTDRQDDVAYTQGQDIYVGRGQNKHLSHEGWHAVQPMQARVQPTIQTKDVSN
jgi:hypothetical protein